MTSILKGLLYIIVAIQIMGCEVSEADGISMDDVVAPDDKFSAQLGNINGDAQIPSPPSGLSVDIEDTVPSYAGYNGVTEAMWEKIDGLGDPLECRSQVRGLINGPKGYQLPSCDGNCINEALRSYDVVTLTGSDYKISESIVIETGKVLKGINGKRVILHADGVDTAVSLDGGTLANIEIQFAENIGVHLRDSSLAYRVIVGNTGVNPVNNNAGFAFSQHGVASTGNCLVSIEAYNGYNEDGNDCESCYLGGNADGVAVKFGAHNTTIIDAHAHHNSDDGFDFWQGGADSSSPTIRVFYSSANENGKHPTLPNKDGNGIKFGSSQGFDSGSRLIYGSAACHNATRGFDRNGSESEIRAINCSSVGNATNYQSVNCTSSDFDPYAVICEN